MRLQGRITGRFLARVVLLVGALGAVFLVWVIWLSVRSTGASLPDLLMVVVAGGLAILGIAGAFARSLVRPMNHMMRWLGELAAGRFAEPVDRRGWPASRSWDGRSRKRPFSTYREVFDSLDLLTAELGRADTERQRIETAREEWIAGVTHDLRTPLTSVRGYADLLASDYETSPEEVRRQAGIISAQASHMEEIIDDLTLTFRLSADALPLQRERVDLIEFVRDRAVDLANDPRIAGREVVFEEPPGTGCVAVEIDPTLFRRALANLMTNAALHNPSGTTVRASVVREGAFAVVRISDDGSGMDAETLGKLFDRYYRGISTASVSEGSGLGMAIARQIIEAHGGSVDARSELGIGTEITLWLRACGLKEDRFEATTRSGSNMWREPFSLPLLSQDLPHELLCLGLRHFFSANQPAENVFGALHSNALSQNNLSHRLSISADEDPSS
ncbi:MAG: sensor histidine kinase [Coriobacteriia bacterium]